MQNLPVESARGSATNHRKIIVFKLALRECTTKKINDSIDDLGWNRLELSFTFSLKNFRSKRPNL